MRPGEAPNSTVCADVDTLELVDMHHSRLVGIDDGLRATVADFRQRYFQHTA